MTQTKEFYLLNNDVIFKNVFNTKERLKRLLESILKVEIYDIKERDKIELYITDVKTHKIRYGNVFKIIDVNMDYFNRLCYTEDMKEEERLLKFLSSKNEKELEANSEGDRFMEEIKDKVYLLNEDPEIIEQLYVEGEERRVRNTERKLGREEGLEQGLEQGVKQGHKEEKLEIAKNMLLKDMDINTISEITGLMPEEIEGLK